MINLLESSEPEVDHRNGCYRPVDHTLDEMKEPLCYLSISHTEQRWGIERSEHHTSAVLAILIKARPVSRFGTCAVLVITRTPTMRLEHESRDGYVGFSMNSKSHHRGPLHTDWSDMHMTVISRKSNTTGKFEFMVMSLISRLNRNGFQIRWALLNHHNLH